MYEKIPSRSESQSQTLKARRYFSGSFSKTSPKILIAISNKISSPTTKTMKMMNRIACLPIYNRAQWLLTALPHNCAYFQITKASSLLNLKWSNVNTFSVRQLTVVLREEYFFFLWFLNRRLWKRPPSWLLSCLMKR